MSGNFKYKRVPGDTKVWEEYMKVWGVKMPEENQIDDQGTPYGASCLNREIESQILVNFWVPLNGIFPYFYLQPSPLTRVRDQFPPVV